MEFIIITVLSMRTQREDHPTGTRRFWKKIWYRQFYESADVTLSTLRRNGATMPSANLKSFGRFVCINNHMGQLLIDLDHLKEELAKQVAELTRVSKARDVLRAELSQQ